MMIYLKLGIAGLLLSSPLFARAKECSELNGNAAITKCLNQYAIDTLNDRSKASLYFTNRLERLTGKFNLHPSDFKHSSLKDSYKIIIENKLPIGSGSQELCFDFESLFLFFPGRYIRHIQKQIDEVALFLAELHSRSWGHQVSILFPVKEVSLCSESAHNDRLSSFTQRTLSVSVTDDVQSAHELIELWDNGSPIRKYDLGASQYLPFGQSMRDLYHAKIKDDKTAIVKDKLAQHWVVLNPFGKLRTSALYILAEAVHKLKNLMEQNGAHQTDNDRINEMSIVLNGPGFTSFSKEKFKRALESPKLAKKLYNIWQAKLLSPENMFYVIEQGIGHQARRNKKVHLVLREINAFFVFSNAKNITVRLESLISTSLPVMNFIEKDSEEESINLEILDGDQSVEVSGNIQDLSINRDKINAAIAFSLIDDVLVSIQIPNISPKAYRRISLYQALDEILLPGELNKLP